MTAPRSTVVVRRAARADLGTLVDLMREFYAEASYSLDPSWAARAFSQLLEHSELGCVWLAEHDRAPAGHAVLTLRYTMEHGAPSGHIDDLFVRPQFRRQGIAFALLSELLAECRQRGCGSLLVEVGNENVAAIELYRRIGLGPFRDGRIVLHGALGATGAEPAETDEVTR